MPELFRLSPFSVAAVQAHHATSFSSALHFFPTRPTWRQKASLEARLSWLLPFPLLRRKVSCYLLYPVGYGYRDCQLLACTLRETRFWPKADRVQTNWQSTGKPKQKKSASATFGMYLCLDASCFSHLAYVSCYRTRSLLGCVV